ncbi:HAD-IIIA family hydrolase [Saxibacter everestensis]|uniref:D,D-heptose 1,7-bisphosphate phosphatase n=1 Tax=Saxibacter everestensis TaxID=2909229 RepID=A0ABY8QTG3_9MICO|nr:HAD-IIIA family hydrolase [Brevibacteriaceae bacterium ZFBP1038]
MKLSVSRVFLVGEEVARDVFNREEAGELLLSMSNTSQDLPRAVLFDRDGTLIADVPDNRDPAQVSAMPTAQDAVSLARSAGARVGVITNQAGVARGLLTSEDVATVNRRVDELFGTFDVWCVCQHAESDGCECRKPKPGMLLRAAELLGLAPADLAFVGDIGSDVAAGTAAGIRTVLVPTPVTRATEIDSAPVVAASLYEAIDGLFSSDDASQLEVRG